MEGLASLCTMKTTSSASVRQVSQARNVRQVGLQDMHTANYFHERPELPKLLGLEEQ